jgi:hypothetical protein
MSGGICGAISGGSGAVASCGIAGRRSMAGRRSSQRMGEWETRHQAGNPACDSIVPGKQPNAGSERTHD